MSSGWFMPPSLFESHSQIRMRRSELVVDLLVKRRVSLSRTASADRGAEPTRCVRMQLGDQGGVESDKPLEPPHLAHEAICGARCRPVRPHKRSPRHRALAAWRYAVCLEDPSNRRPTNTMPEVLQGTLDPRIAPRVVLTGQAQNEGPGRVLVHADAPLGAVCAYTCDLPARGANAESCPLSQWSPPAPAWRIRAGVRAGRDVAVPHHKVAGVVRAVAPATPSSLPAGTR